MRVLRVAILAAVIGTGFTASAHAQYNCVPTGPKDFVTGITPMRCDGVGATGFYCTFGFAAGGGPGCTGPIPNDECGHALASSFQQCSISTDPLCYQMAYNLWSNCRQLTGGNH
jgi:hypothetical protein